MQQALKRGDELSRECKGSSQTCDVLLLLLKESDGHEKLLSDTTPERSPTSVIRIRSKLFCPCLINKNFLIFSLETRVFLQ